MVVGEGHHFNSSWVAKAQKWRVGVLVVLFLWDHHLWYFLRIIVRWNKAFLVAHEKGNLFFIRVSTVLIKCQMFCLDDSPVDIWPFVKFRCCRHFQGINFSKNARPQHQINAAVFIIIPPENNKMSVRNDNHFAHTLSGDLPHQKPQNGFSLDPSLISNIFACRWSLLEMVRWENRP